MNILDIIQQSITKIDIIIQEEHPKILAKMAEELFANEGNFNGHSTWDANAPSTIKRKGGNSPNIETGFLEHNMSTPGFLENDNWLESIKSSKKDGDYKYADKLRKFSDVGRTEQDEQYIENELEKKLEIELTS